MLRNQLLPASIPASEYGKWVHSSWPWQLFVTVRLPKRDSSDDLRRQIQAGLVRPLSKFVKAPLVGIGTLVRWPCPHAHLLLYSRDTDLSHFSTHGPDGRPNLEGIGLLDQLTRHPKDPLRFKPPQFKDGVIQPRSVMHIEPYRSQGGADYWSKNLLQNQDVSSLWTFGQRLLLRDQGQPAQPLRDLFFGQPAVPAVV